MSRGDRATVTGNLSSSMRDNYSEHGVAEYYTKVGSTYRNPHYPGVRLCIFAWLSKWWSNESSMVKAEDTPDVLLFDMACGSGEVTVAFHEWFTLCKQVYYNSDTNHSSLGQPKPPSRKYQTYIVPLGPEFPTPLVAAADPFTSVAYKDRTSLSCATLSFHDIAQGELPPFVSDLSKVRVQAPPPLETHDQPQSPGRHSSRQDENTQIEDYVASSEVPYTTLAMVVCSFALHLIDSPSALFALLCALSYKARWLVVLAPHKKPEIKGGWGWEKWNVEEWRAVPMSSHDGEILFDRVHCRVYRSINF